MQDAQKQEKLTRQIAFINYHIRRVKLVLEKEEKEEGMIVSRNFYDFFSTYLSNHEYLSHTAQMDEYYREYLGKLLPDFLSDDEEVKSVELLPFSRLKPVTQEIKTLKAPMSNKNSFSTMFELSYLTKPRARVTIIS